MLQVYSIWTWTYNGGWGWQTTLQYLGGKSLNENGNKEVEEDVISERHQGDEVESCPGWRAGHTVVQHLVPVFLR